MADPISSSDQIKGMRIAFAGAGAFGVPTLKRLVGAGAQIVAVYTQPDRPAGRGKVLSPTPIAAAAEALHLSVVRTADLNVESLPAVDVLVVIAFGQKIAPHVVDHPTFGAINLHASLLPKHRGAAPVHAAIVSGDKIAGNSIIRLADKMDAGAVLGTNETEIGETETTGELHDRLAEIGAPLVEQVLAELRNGTAIETPQDHSQATLARKLNRESTRIDFNRTAREVADQIRGLYPWPGCRVRVMLNDREVVKATLIRARPFAGVGEPGTVLPNGLIACRDGAIELLELQPEGKRPMSLTAFRNGRPWTAGLRLESIV
ncbi:MAG: methionyl-tRNA formyltransferase [Phycisphaerales bacterium]|nr:methionyl-tRNA formyltransferase [Phycisphaerales bacterium]